MVRLRIRRVTAWNIGATVVVGLMFFVISFWGNREFHVLQDATERYILCERAAKNLQDGSNYLTEQVRLFAITGQQVYMDNYFAEAADGRREKALEELRPYFEGTHTFDALQTALNYSEDLMDTEYYSMRLVLEAKEVPEDTWPAAVRTVELSAADTQLTAENKLRQAQRIVCDNAYQTVRSEIMGQITECMDSLIQQTRDEQGRATTIFEDMYRKMEIGVAVLVVMMLTMCVMVRRLVGLPLMKCNQSIRQGERFPVEGAAELQTMAETYNKVYLENQEAQVLIRHKAEHDPLTDLLNRGSFEKLLKLHEEGEAPFALIIVDVDCFKSVNDTCGHAAGDKTLKKVAELLLTAFRSIDHVCRIGGDEFAIIMVEMTSDLAYTIQKKIDAVNETLTKQEGDGPKVSLSVGVVFSDRKNPSRTIFEDADKALYEQKNHGKWGCSFYEGLPAETETSEH